MSMGRPRPCRECGLRPRAVRGSTYCYECMPGGPHVPPPCTRCGSTRDYYSGGLCSRCHLYAPQQVDSCRDCHAWGATRHWGWLCQGCVGWRAAQATTAACRSCGVMVALDEHRFCRLCRKQATRARTRKLDVIGANRHGQQLFLADTFHRTGSRSRREEPDRVPLQIAQPVSRRQLVLFPPVRDLRSRGLANLPQPAAPHAAAFLDARARDHGLRHGWSTSTTWKVRTGIRILLSLQDTAGAAIAASEIVALRGTGIPMRAITAVLTEAGFHTDDLAPTIQDWFERKTSELPDPMTAELRTWFQVMLHGSPTPPRRLPRSTTTIKIQLGWALPTLHTWAQTGHTSLREISRQDVKAALPASGNARATTGQGLRSIFRLLKASKITFTDPTARIPTGYAAPAEPLPIDLQALRQALNSTDPAQAALVALSAFHGLRSSQLRNLRLTDIRDHRLHINDRVILLAAPARARIAAYLDYRHQRWPATANPYLFLTQRSATRTDAAGRRWTRLKAGVIGATQAIREDRILHEAHATGGDARRLFDLFGISITAAERYIATLDPPGLTDVGP